MTPFEVLNIKPTKNINEVTKAYRLLVHIAHPDAGGSDEHFKQIQEAYEKLKTDIDFYFDNKDTEKESLFEKVRKAAENFRKQQKEKEEAKAKEEADQAEAEFEEKMENIKANRELRNFRKMRNEYVEHFDNYFENYKETAEKVKEKEENLTKKRATSYKYGSKYGENYEYDAETDTFVIKTTKYETSRNSFYIKGIEQMLYDTLNMVYDEIISAYSYELFSLDVLYLILDRDTSNIASKFIIYIKKLIVKKEEEKSAKATAEWFRRNEEKEYQKRRENENNKNKESWEFY
jgi:curved DNA-binding protein CbpA